MTRSLRKVHLGLMALLTPVAIGIFVASIAARKAIPPNTIPASLQPPMPEMQETGRRVIKGEGLTVQLRGLMDQNGARFIEITPLNQPHIADLLAYIGPGKSDAFDDHVRLLGQVYASCPVRFALPVDSTQTLSEIYLYSGATHEVIARVNLADSARAAP